MAETFTADLVSTNIQILQTWVVRDCLGNLLHTLWISVLVMLHQALLEAPVILYESAEIGDGGSCQATPANFKVAYASVIKFVGQDFHAAVMDVAVSQA